jgi:hypothetical protein
MNILSKKNQLTKFGQCIGKLLYWISNKFIKDKLFGSFWYSPKQEYRAYMLDQWNIGRDRLFYPRVNFMKPFFSNKSRSYSEMCSSIPFTDSNWEDAKLVGFGFYDHTKYFNKGY